MRTATPFATWSRITDERLSATSGAISTPRLIGSRMHHDRAGFGQFDTIGRQPIQPRIFPDGREQGTPLPFQLQPQHHDDLHSAQGLIEIIEDRRAQFLDCPSESSSGGRQREPRRPVSQAHEYSNGPHGCAPRRRRWRREAPQTTILVRESYTDQATPGSDAHAIRLRR